MSKSHDEENTVMGQGQASCRGRGVVDYGFDSVALTGERVFGDCRTDKGPLKDCKKTTGPSYRLQQQQKHPACLILVAGSDGDD